MPKPEEIATVVANGQSYNNWTSVEVERSYDNVVVHLRLTAAEKIDKNGEAAQPSFISSIRLRIGDTVQAYLAGRKVIDGYVTVRQVFYDANQHQLMIVVSSITYRLPISTVDGTPGQYHNATLKQIAKAVFGKVGVNFSIVGSPAGADKPFPRVSETIGETRFAFINRLCRMRDLQMVDDLRGGIMATRDAAAASGAMLVEGKNIKAARMIMSINDSADGLRTVAQQPQTDDNHEQGASSEASTTVPNVPPTVPMTFACEINGDHQDCIMRVNRERSQMLYEQLECNITVTGWLRDDGTLWIEHVNDTISIYSPMLFPDDTMTLYIKGVKHRQDNDSGTTTDVLLSFRPGGDGLLTAPPDVQKLLG